MKRKNRKQKENEYVEKYGMIPIDYKERLYWLNDTLKINDRKAQEIIDIRNQMYNFLYYRTYKIILFEEPEGSPRPRFRLINRQNLVNSALANGSFVHVYSINAHEDNVFMSRLTDSELYELDSIIYTPCDVEYNTFHKTPSYFNTEETMLAEIGLQRPLTKPDWDNIGKKYSDMSNGNIWIDDTCVISGTVNKFYSVLPRVEINLKFLNCVYNRHQARSIAKKIDNDVIYFKKEK
jgi:Holliday junction resolvase RusA-like endonuclease